VVEPSHIKVDELTLIVLQNSKTPSCVCTVGLVHGPAGAEVLDLQSD